MRPQDMKVITGFSGEGHLEIIEDDILTILDGRCWDGQSYFKFEFSGIPFFFSFI